MNRIISKLKTREFLYYILGAALIFIILFITVLRHEGYILYWDMSGSFDFRDPFEQYSTLETAYDGLNVGVRNRLPIATIIVAISKFISFFGFKYEYLPIKVATTFMFLGAYSSFYWLYPKFRELLSKDKLKNVNGHAWLLLRVLFAILYILIPWYAARIPQLHLFFLSTFYPLHIYLFIRLLKAEVIDVKAALLFALSLFLGLTSPHIVFIDLITFIALFIAFLPSKLINPKLLLNSLGNFGIAGSLVLLTNLYWLIPFVMSDTPSPGYVINDSMVQILTQNTNLTNFLLGQSEWFSNQLNLSTILSDKQLPLRPVQFFGVISMFLLFIITVIRNIKNQIIVAALFLMAFSLLLVVKSAPFHSELFDSILYSPVGWIIREPNKMQIIWSFWLFLIFVTGVEGLLIYAQKSDIKKPLLFFIISGLVSYTVYTTPINFIYGQHLKPDIISQDLEAVFNHLESDDDTFFVHYYPNTEPYYLGWDNTSFDIADKTEYKFIPYNSPKPPTQISTVVPNARSFENLYMDYIIRNRESFEDIGPYIAEIGVKYIVIAKDSRPTSFSYDENQTVYITPLKETLNASNSFELEVSNDKYLLYKVKDFDSSYDIYQYEIQTYDGFNILKSLTPETLKESKILFCDFEKFHSRCEDTKDPLRISNQKNDFIEFIPNPLLQQYSVFPYDFTNSFGTNITWGKASFTDKINAEFHNIQRAYGLNSWDFNYSDKVAYSDSTFLDPDKSGEMIFTIPTKCKERCEVYLHYLKSSIGGDLSIEIDGDQYVLTTETSQFEDDNFQWALLDLRDYPRDEVEITLTSISGFNAIGSILTLPEETADQYRFMDIKNSHIMNLIAKDNPLSCAIRQEDPFKYQLVLNCDERVTVERFTDIGARFLTVNKSTDYTLKIETTLDEGRNDITVRVINVLDIFSWPLFIISANLLIAGIFILKYPSKSKAL